MAACRSSQASEFIATKLTFGHGPSQCPSNRPMSENWHVVYEARAGLIGHRQRAEARRQKKARAGEGPTTKLGCHPGTDRRLGFERGGVRYPGACSNAARPRSSLTLSRRSRGRSAAERRPSGRLRLPRHAHRSAGAPCRCRAAGGGDAAHTARHSAEPGPARCRAVSRSGRRVERALDGHNERSSPADISAHGIKPLLVPARKVVGVICRVLVFVGPDMLTGTDRRGLDDTCAAIMGTRRDRPAATSAGSAHQSAQTHAIPSATFGAWAPVTLAAAPAFLASTHQSHPNGPPSAGAPAQLDTLIDINLDDLFEAAYAAGTTDLSLIHI